MTNPLRFVVALLATIVGGLFALTPSSVPNAAGATSVVQVHAYDTPADPAPDEGLAWERGPPVTGYVNTSYDAVVLRSHGTSARSESVSRQDQPTTYDSSAPLAQITRGAGTPQTRAQGDAGALLTLVRSEVAANAGAPAIKAGSAGGETAGKAFPRSVRNDVLDDNPNVCVYCRTETDRPQVDHVNRPRFDAAPV